MFFYFCWWLDELLLALLFPRICLCLSAVMFSLSLFLQSDSEDIVARLRDLVRDVVGEIANRIWFMIHLLHCLSLLIYSFAIFLSSFCLLEQPKLTLHLPIVFFLSNSYFTAKRWHYRFAGSTFADGDAEQFACLHTNSWAVSFVFLLDGTFAWWFVCLWEVYLFWLLSLPFYPRLQSWIKSIFKLFANWQICWHAF